MSRLIKKWKQQLNANTHQYNELYEDKLLTKVNNEPKKEIKLTYFLNNDVYPLGCNLCNIFAIYNLAIKIPNENMTPRTLKIIEFYKAFNPQKVEERKITLSKGEKFYKNIIHVTKFGIFQELCNFHREEKPCNKVNLQLPHDFFFYGPRVPELSHKTRHSLKNNILNSLTITNKNKNIITDGFQLFDYAKVQELSFHYEKGQTGKYLKTFNQQGKIIYGGYSNPRDGGESPFSLENFYYKHENLFIDAIFKEDINLIKKMLEKTISPHRSIL